MPVPRSRSRSGSPSVRGGTLLASLCIVTLCLLCSGCGPLHLGREPTVWGVPLEEMRARLHGGDHAFLRHVDGERVNSREALRLGREAPYCLALVFRSLGVPVMEARMLELGARHATGLWQERCTIELSRAALARGEAEEVLRILHRGRKGIRTEEGTVAAERMRLQALFELRRDEELLRALATVQQADLDAEMLLMRAVSAARSEFPEWEEEFRLLGWHYPSSPVHVRALAFLEEEQGRLGRFSPEEVALFRAKSAFSSKQLEEAWPLFVAVLSSLQAPAGSVVPEEALQACLVSRRYEEGIQLMRTAPLRAAGEGRARELEGRVHRVAGRYEEAARELEAAVALAQDAGSRQRALWYYLDSRMKSGERRLGSLFSSVGRWVVDVGFYADLVDEAIVALLERRDWQELRALRSFLAVAGATGTLARCDFVLSRALVAGLTSASEGEDPEGWLREALAADPHGYYAALSAALLDEPFRPLECGRTGQAEPAPEAGGDAGEGEMLGVLLRYGLTEQAYELAQAAAARLPRLELVSAARQLETAGRHLWSVRLMNALAARTQSCLRPEELLLQFPNLYINDIQRLARANDLEQCIVLAVVREESHFDAGIVSRSGAVGLMQLMPATAQETAAKVGLGTYDLRDPTANLELGLRHLADLQDRTLSVPKALCAYNAGLSRVRQWERAASDLPPELFAELIPFAETRAYLRKVLVSAVMYGALYELSGARETVALFYPRLLEGVLE